MADFDQGIMYIRYLYPYIVTLCFISCSRGNISTHNDISIFLKCLLKRNACKT